MTNAFQFAEKAHAGAFRKGFPAHYIAHPYAVASIVMEYTGASPRSDIVCGAILHDVIEDTEFSRQDLANEFGEYIAALVDAVSHDPNLKGTPKKEAYVKRLNDTKLFEAVMISCADKFDNLRSIRHQQLMDAEGANQFRNGLWFYDALLPIYDRVLPKQYTQAGPLLALFRQVLNDVKVAYESGLDN